MSNDKKSLLTLLVVLVLIVSFFGLWGAWKDTSSLNESEIRGIVATEVGKIKMPDVTIPSVPTAQEIADLVVIPGPGDVDNDRINDLWEDMYSEGIKELEDAAELNAKAELKDDDWEILEEYLELTIEGFYEIEDVDYEDTEITVLNLGLGEDEDKVVEVVYELEVEYSLKEGPVTNHRKIVFATANIVYEEGGLDDEEVVITFA